MNVRFVDLKSQYDTIKNEIDAAIAGVIEQCAFVGGREVERFESEFAEFCNSSYCVGVGNGTDALFIALKALGIGAGDEVITAANSFVATSEAITQTGASVVFVDVDPRTYNMAIDQVEDRITSRTRAIIPVHLYGQPAEMNPLQEIARKHDLRIVEDAAQAHDAEYKGRRVGSLGDVACFSFYPGKNLGAYGDGGAIVTSSEELARRARMFANHGRLDKYNHEVEGVNSRLDGLQAAVLRVKLRHLSKWTDSRRRNAYLYGDQLSEIAVETPVEIDDVRAVYHLYVVRVEAERRQALRDHLQSNGIATGVHYPIALPNLNAYRHLGHKESDFPEATRSSQEIVSLPMFPELSAEQVEYVAQAIKSFYA